MKYIVGLGNPGQKYADTRHNVGFRVVESLGAGGRWAADRKLNAMVSKTAEGDLLVKPETFVNETGRTVSAMLDLASVESADVLFVCDDVNLDLGKLRLRESGSAGGHHGLESVIAALGSEDFPRLRIGVRTEEMPSDLSGFVLEEFGFEEKKKLGKALDKAVQVCENWLREGFGAAVNRLSQLQNYPPQSAAD